MTVDEWLEKRIDSYPVLATTILREAKARGYSHQDLLEAYDLLKLTFIKKSGGSKRVYWWKKDLIQYWIWVTFIPPDERYRKECLHILKKKGFTQSHGYHWGRCPLPKTFIERKGVIQWTEESSFSSKGNQNKWLEEE